MQESGLCVILHLFLGCRHMIGFLRLLRPVINKAHTNSTHRKTIASAPFQRLTPKIHHKLNAQDTLCKIVERVAEGKSSACGDTHIKEATPVQLAKLSLRSLAIHITIAAFTRVATPATITIRHHLALGQTPFANFCGSML